MRFSYITIEVMAHGTWKRLMVKLQFRRLMLFKKRGYQFQEEFCLPSFFSPSLGNWWWDFPCMALFRVYFSKFLSMKPPDTFVISRNGIHYDRRSWTIYRRVVSSIEARLWLSHAPAFWCHDRDVNNRSMMMLLIFQRPLAMFMEVNSAFHHTANVMKSM